MELEAYLEKLYTDKVRDRFTSRYSPHRDTRPPMDVKALTLIEVEMVNRQL